MTLKSMLLGTLTAATLFSTAGCVTSPFSTLLSGDKPHPPAWTIGQWGEPTGSNTLVFTSDNLVIKARSTTSSAEINMSEMFAGRFKEQTEEGTYAVSVDAGTAYATYTFKKVDDTHITYTNQTNGKVIGTIRMTKQGS